MIRAMLQARGGWSPPRAEECFDRWFPDSRMRSVGTSLVHRSIGDPSRTVFPSRVRTPRCGSSRSGRATLRYRLGSHRPAPRLEKIGEDGKNPPSPWRPSVGVVPREARLKASSWTYTRTCRTCKPPGGCHAPTRHKHSRLNARPYRFGSPRGGSTRIARGKEPPDLRPSTGRGGRGGWPRPRGGPAGEVPDRSPGRGSSGAARRRPSEGCLPSPPRGGWAARGMGGGDAP